MVRTELDALPMEEKTGLAYASHDKTNWNGRETFVAHSCGHDIHMASWVGTAKTLVGLKDQWQGTLMFIAQPAEETVSGAKAMLADGLFTRFKKPDFGFALHDGAFAYGSVSYRVGIGSSNSDGLFIKFPGRGRAEQLGVNGRSALAYRPRSRAGDADEFVAELQARLQTDVERGFSSHGPHRDELAILRDERELRVYGSQGEQRLVLLGLLLAERELLAAERGRTPLMLLDDVMSELDAERRRLLAEELSAGGQSVIATTDLAHVPGGSDQSVTRLLVSPGTILQEAIAA